MEQKVIQLMAEIFEIPINDFPKEVKQENIKEWNSLRHLNLIVELEETFDKSFEPDEISEMKSLEKILFFINR